MRTQKLQHMARCVSGIAHKWRCWTPSGTAFVWICTAVSGIDPAVDKARQFSQPTDRTRMQWAASSSWLDVYTVTGGIPGEQEIPARGQGERGGHASMDAWLESDFLVWRELFSSSPHTGLLKKGSVLSRRFWSNSHQVRVKLTMPSLGLWMRANHTICFQRIPASKSLGFGAS